MSKTPTIDRVSSILGKRFNVIDWSMANGNDCKSILGMRDSCVLFFEPGEKPMWFVQRTHAYDDPSVGIFGAIEPDEIVAEFDADETIDAVRRFLAVSAEADEQATIEHLYEQMTLDEQDEPA